jgi:hypothetical protein
MVFWRAASRIDKHRTAFERLDHDDSIVKLVLS